MLWLLRNECDLLHEVADVRRTLASRTAEQYAAFTARAEAGTSAERVLCVVGDVAVLAISGVLVPHADLWLSLLGAKSTTYADIRAALELAEQDPRVGRIQLAINSPGGTMSGLFESMEAIGRAKKPVEVVATQACSAAYGLAAVAGAIRAASVASEFGSIGAAMRVGIDDGFVEITNTASPKKRPDVRTEAGRAVVREYLDQVHALFASAVARGRQTTVDRVNKEFGLGATVLAGHALAAGMIDKIGAAPAPSPAHALAAQIPTKNQHEVVADLVERLTTRRRNPITQGEQAK